MKLLYKYLLVFFFADIQQFEFRCDSTNWFTPSDNFGDSEGATFNTPLRTDCGLCMRLTSVSPLYDRYDNVTHCVGKWP